MTLRMYPDGDPFPALAIPILTYEQLRREELEHPERFATEYRAQWASVMNAYLEAKFIARAFEPWKGARLTMQSVGRNEYEYYAHADPSRSGANFGLAIGHLEYDDAGEPHVVIDLIRVWQPRDFPKGEINYVQVENELFEYIKAFRIAELTFDQWNSAGTIDHLRDRIQHAGFWWRTAVSERTATQTINWDEAENFSTALRKDRVHLPHLELTEQELLSLQYDGHKKVTPPATGPCTTSDTADCLFALTHRLLEGRFGPQALSRVQLHGSYPGGIPISAHDQSELDQLSSFGRGQNWHSEQRQRPPRRSPNRGLRRGRGFGVY
jgi:hypothetical protein